MPVLDLRPREECAFDHVSLGEVMLRLDPGDMRVKTAREFRAWEGGGEYNVARGLRRCFGLRTAIVTALADNAVGRLVEDLMMQGGVDVSQVRWVPYDGLGRTVRNGLNFTERGFGIRGAQGVSDRGHTAASQLKPDDIDWEHIFGTLGARWFHTGGIYAGLSETAPEVIEAAMTAARRHGTVVSYDLNYRPSLWKSYGGQRRAQEVNRALAEHVDVMIGNEEDFTACLGFGVPNTGEDLTGLEAANFKAMISQVTAEFDFSVVATTLRGVISATVNDWGAIAWSADSGFVEARHRPALEIYDRVGGGDSFASGLIYGLLTTGDLQEAVDYGAAHGALAMTTPGDTSMASLTEVEALMAGAGARVQRLSPERSTTMTTLRWGLIGASDIAATRIIPAMRRLGHQVTGVSSLSEEHAAEYAHQHQIPYATSGIDLLVSRDDVDAVYISTINRLHYQHTLIAARAGKHVLCEKPAAMNLTDAWSMVRACGAAGLVFGVNHHLPCAATHREIRRLVAGGAVGQPLGVRVFHAVQLPERLATWRLTDPAAGAGVPLDITVHDAAVVNRLLGRPLDAAALGVRQGPWGAAVDDAIMSVLRYEGNVLAQTHDAFTVRYAGTGLEVHGAEGSILARDVMTQDPVGSVLLRDSGGERELDIGGRRDLYEVSLEEFARAVEEKAEPAVTGADGVRALAVALAVQEAASSGRQVPIVTEPVAEA